MSKQNKNKNNSMNVGHLNFSKLEKDISTEENVSESVYKKFCEVYLEKDFEKIKSSELKKIYEDGIELLNNFYITNKDKEISNTIFQIQFITIKINSVIEKRQNQELMRRNRELNNNLSEMINRAEKLEKDANYEKEEIKHMKNDIKSIITTILAIVLAFSIIPTAISAMENINANYILPFVSSIILFGMLMTIFIYSIYQDKIKLITWFISGIMIMICILLWINTIFGFIKINNDKIGNNNIAEQIIEEN